MSLEAYKSKHLEQKENYQELTILNSTSKVAVWKLWIYIVSFVANTLRELYSVHKNEVEYLIKTQKTTNIDYYRTAVLNYRHGHPFDRENLIFTGNYTPTEISSAQIVKRAAVQAVSIEGRRKLFLKLATENSNGKLSKIDDNTLEKIEQYMQPNIGAGTYIQYFSDKPDEIRIELDVYIDLQILSTDGTRTDGSDNTPIQTAIQDFFKDKNFKFDGEIVLSLLTDKIQDVEGILDRSVSFKKAESNYKTPKSWELINERYTANSGYFEILPENLTINYLVKE